MTFMRTLCPIEKSKPRFFNALRTLLQNTGGGDTYRSGNHSSSRMNPALVRLRSIPARQAFFLRASPSYCLVDHYRVPCYKIRWSFLSILACLIPEKAKEAEEAC
jgi:hypothetical protein